jgi:hypothetical protein
MAALCLLSVIFAVFSPLIFLCFSAYVIQSCKSNGIAEILYTVNRDCLGTKFGFGTLFRIPNVCKDLL